MNDLAKIWTSLALGQRVSVICVPLLLLLAGWAGFQWKHAGDFRPLYTGLAAEDAAAVTQKIREAGIEYKLDELGSAVFVPSSRVAEARLALASAGLPKTGRIGFELFDRNNLGASDFAEQVNYRRALEGELERTVGTISEIEQARVHLSFGRESVFLEARQPSKATVVIRVHRGAQLGQASVQAIANLVSSAVEGLLPGAVAIVDAAGRLLNRPRAGGDGDAVLAEANLDYRHQVEAEFLAKINSELTPLLGADRFRAGVNAECDFTSSEENEESFDPSGAVLLSSQNSEESAGATVASGNPGTSSNLPRATPRTVSPGGGTLRRTESSSFQPSRLVKRTILPKGSVRRISAAVLVDQTVVWEGVGPKAKRTLQPPSPQVLKVVHDVVAGVVGFSDDRGDQITIETLPFENTLAAEPPSLPIVPVTQTFGVQDLKRPVVAGPIAGAVLLLVGLVFLLTRKRKSVPQVVDAAPTPISGVAAAQLTPQEARAEADRKVEQQISDNDAAQAQMEAEALNRIKLPDHTKKTEVLVKHIRESVQKDSLTATNVLRAWMADQPGHRNS